MRKGTKPIFKFVLSTDWRTLVRTPSLYSSDSMAWSFAGRKHGTEHDPRIALAYAAKMEALIGQPSFVQPNFSIGGTKRNMKHAKRSDPFDSSVVK
jgi:hypothetical protein